MKIKTLSLVAVLTAAIWAGPPKGASVQPADGEAALLAGLKGKITGKIVWSTSRDGNHDIYMMNADGTDPKALTKGPKTDWFSRFSPDGSKVIFTRSKMDWTAEANADNEKMWDTWIISADGSGEKLLIPNSVWATWRPDGKAIVFARGTQVWTFDVASNQEKLICESKDKANGFENEAILQNPHMSPDGKFLAITLRGKMRETGVWDMTAKTWIKSGLGCQINWFPAGDRIVRIHPTGNGENQVVSYFVKNGRPVNSKMSEKDMALIDLPGRRSHEYFPQISQDGKWMVWAATQRGHDHDIADYEIYVWNISASQDSAVRLTFHSGNDRWPDIMLGH